MVEVLQGFNQSMTFDWYQASVPTKVDNLIEAFAERFPALEWVSCQGVKQYDRALRLSEFGETLFVLSYGGNNGADPNCRSTGFSASIVAPVLRECFPKHRVSRLDAAIDFSKKDIFDIIHAFMDKIHFDSGIARKDYGFASPENGRTFYLGSNKSPMQVRLYEKGKKAIQDGFKDADPYWVRLEAQYRPRSAEKAKFASVEPIEVWGAARWSRNLISAIISEHPTPIRQEKPLERSDEEKARFVARQYKRLFTSLGRQKIIDILGEEIFDRWDDLPEVSEIPSTSVLH